MRNYYPPRLDNLKDFSLRRILRPMDSVLRELSAQNNRTGTGLTAASTAGNVSSIGLNSTSKHTGDITLTATSPMLLTNSLNNFNWAFDSATYFTSIAATPTITYSTAYAAGTATTFPRSDSVLVYPEALGTAADRTKTLTLTNDGTYGTLLTSSSGFSVNALALQAPSAAKPLVIGKYGNFSVNGGIPADNVLMTFTKSFSSGDASGAPFFISGVLSDMGDAPILTSGTAGYGVVSIVAQPSVTGAWGATAKAAGVWNTSLTFSNTNIGTNTKAFIYGAKFTNSQTNAVTVAAPFYSYSIVSGIGRTLSNVSHFYAENLSISGTVTRQALIAQSAAWTSGSTKRSLDAMNTAEVAGNDFLCSTTAKGLICKDSQGTARYWRLYFDSTGTKGLTFTQDANGYVNCLRTASPTGNFTLNLQDTGTSAPTA